MLSFFIKNKWLSFGILGICVALMIVFAKTLKSELAPLEDHSYVRTYVTAPEGTEYTTTKKIIDEIAAKNLDTVPEAKYVLARYGGGRSSSVNSGFIITFLTDPTQRKASQQEIYDQLSDYYKTIPDARVIASQEPTISTAFGRVCRYNSSCRISTLKSSGRYYRGSWRKPRTARYSAMWMLT